MENNKIKNLENDFENFKNEKKYKKCIEILDRIIEFDPSSKSLYLYFYKRGTIKKILLDYKSAIQDFSECIKLNNNYYLALYERGNCYNGTIDYENDSIKRMDNIHDIFKKVGNVELAEQDFDSVIKIAPNFPPVYYSKGFLLSNRKKNDEEALPLFTKCFGLDINNICALYRRGISYKNINDFDSAKDDFLYIIKNKPKFSHAYNALGNLYYDMHQYKKALIEYKKCIKISPDYDDAYCNMGLVYENIDKFEKGIIEYENCIRIKNDHEYALAGKGSCYYFLDDYENAFKYLFKSLEVCPTNSYVNGEMRTLLRRLNINKKCSIYILKNELFVKEVQKLYEENKLTKYMNDNGATPRFLEFNNVIDSNESRSSLFKVEMDTEKNFYPINSSKTKKKKNEGSFVI